MYLGNGLPPTSGIPLYNGYMEIYTIGYGGRAIGDFIGLLKRYGIQALVDARSMPYSRFRPDYRKKLFQQHLEGAGIEYRYMGEALGGKLLDPQYVIDGKVDVERLQEREDVRAALDQIEAAVRAGELLAMMCAEQRPEQCHRAWMLAPMMLGRGIEVLHIDERGELKTQEQLNVPEWPAPPKKK